MAAWTVARGSPTRLVPLMAVRRSPMLRAPERSAGPLCSRLAMTAVGSKEPQPDSTRATPRPSPLCFSMTTWEGTQVGMRATQWGTGRRSPAHLLTSLQFSLLEKWSRSPLWRWPGPVAPWFCWVPTWLGSMPLSRRNWL